MEINPNDSLTLLFRDVLNVLSEITVSGEKLFKYVAPFSNQFERLGTSNNFDINNMPINRNLPFDFPACFVETLVDATNDLAASYQEINGRLVVYVGLHDYDLDKDVTKPYSIRFLVHQALHLLGGYESSYTLRRATEMTDPRYSNVYVYQLVYQFICTDNTTTSEYAIFGTNGFDFNIDIQK